jgi:hypothetical protein
MKNKNNVVFIKVLLILFTIVTNAQNPENNADNNYIPNFFPTTPQVASLSKASEIPVDISTGRLNYNIPIFEISEGNFNMPINLSYNYSGLQVDETPGYAGVGWTFNIGGSILHNIKSLNDEEHPNDKTKIHNYINKIPPYHDENLPESKAMILDLYEKLSKGNIDGRPDKYSINIGNINCSFYLDKDNNPIFLKNEKYNLIVNSSGGYTLTDDKGINYLFNLKQLSQSWGPSFEGTNYTSSFLITEINFPNSSNKILFEYQPQNTLYDIYDSYSSTKTQIGYYTSWSTNSNRTYTSSTVSKLSKIITDDYTIELQYENNPNEAAVSVIKKLEIKNINEINVRTYDFEYTEWFGRRRNLLNVKYNNEIINSMEYDGNSYPTFSQEDLSKKDLWGYYNISGSLPMNNAPINPLDNPSIKPNFESTKIGSLKKITYQTKGYSLIEYEPNKVFMNLSDYNFPYPSDSNVSQTFSATTTNSGITQETSFVVTSVPVTLNLYNVLSNETQINGCCERLSEVIFYEQGQESNPIFYKEQLWTKDGTWIPSQSTFVNQSSVIINTPGTYFLKAKSSAGSTAHITTILQQSLPSFNQTVGGIRVKEVKNCDFNGTCTTTTYNYSQSGNSTGIMLQKPHFFSGYFIVDTSACTTVQSMEAQIVKTYNYSYNSITPLSNFRGSPVLYKIVEQSNISDNDANGKTIFSFSGNTTNFLHDEGYDIGQLDEKTIKTRLGQIVQKQKNKYLNNVPLSTRKYVEGLECKLVRETWIMLPGWQGNDSSCWSQPNRPLTDFVTETFTHESLNYFLEKEDVFSYFNGNVLQETTYYNYSADTGYTKSKTSTNSKGEILETKYYYPDDLPNEPNVGSLISKNMVGIPIITETYKTSSSNTEKLSQQVTKYGTFPSSVVGQNLLLPQYVYAGKESNIEKKITYDSYDTKGNILQYTPENGIPTSIIWGYNKTLPIAKIENATNAQVQTALGMNLSDVTEANMSIINALRASLHNAMVTTYTHKPLVGVSTITDPKGDSMTYIYDSFNRLKEVQDKNGNKLSENQYHYRPQN